MKFAFKLMLCLALISGAAVCAQGRGNQLPPSNLDPPPKQAPEPAPEPAADETPAEEQKRSIFDYVDPSEPRFYAKLGLLLGSILLARKAYRQMKMR